MKPLPAKAVIKILLKNGFSFSRQNGSHQVYYNNRTGRTVIVAAHGANRPISIGTFISIMKQSGLDKSDWKK